METGPLTEQVASAVKQHEATQEDCEQIVSQQQTQLPYPVISTTGAQESRQYGGQYGSLYDVNTRPVGSRELDVVARQQVSISTYKLCISRRRWRQPGAVAPIPCNLKKKTSFCCFLAKSANFRSHLRLTQSIGV